jgi:hypothetical protein
VSDIPEELRAEFGALSDAEIENRLSNFSEKKRKLARAYLEERQANRFREAQFEQTEIATRHGKARKQQKAQTRWQQSPSFSALFRC